VPRNAHRGGEHETLDNNNERARYQKHPARPRRPVKQNDGRTPSGQGAPQTRQAPAQAKQTSSFFDGASTTSSPLFSPQLSQPLLRLPQSSQRNQAQSSSNPSTSPFVSSTCRYNNTLFSRAASTLRVLTGTLFITGLLLFTGQSSAYATDGSGQEQVVVSPAQQAVNDALAAATTEVQQAVDATANAATEISQAQAQVSDAQSAVSNVSSSVTLATSDVNAVQTAITSISSVDLAVTPIDQSSQVVVDAKATVSDAQASITDIAPLIATAQTEVTQLTTERQQAVTAQATAQTELTQANISIDSAQNAVNALQATVGTSTNVLAGVDDAGVIMNLPFSLLMGGTLYNNVYVGSNATITFGVNEGANYYSTPNAPSVSIAAWDWTTWSTGTGITYATTSSSLDIAWDLRPFPQQDASTQMVQIRFNADVNPTDGAWKADVTAIGPIPDQARFNYRETNNGAVTNIVDTNEGAGFAGHISQGANFTPTVDSSISGVQAAVDSANAVIAQLNSSLTPVVSQNAVNNSALSTLLSQNNTLTGALTSATTTKNSLQTLLDGRATTLTQTINENIPTPAPVVAEPVVEGTTVTIAPELPQGYTANTWFYQVTTDDPDAVNPYEGGTYNTDGAPETIQLTGLTEGATYTVSVANWSGPVSQYTDVVVVIPAEETVQAPSQPSYIVAPEFAPVYTDPVDTNPVDTEPIDTEPVDTEPVDTNPVDTEPIDTDPVDTEPVDTEPVDVETDYTEMTVDEVQDAVEDLINDGAITDADAEAVIDALLSDGDISVSEISDLASNLTDGGLSSAEAELVIDALTSDGTVTNSEMTALVTELVSEGGLSSAEAELVVDALSADGEITISEVTNLSEALTEDGTFTLAEKDLVSDVLVSSAEGAPVEAASIAAAGLEYRDLPPAIPVEVREDLNGNPVVITAEVASALLTLESPAALVGAITGCFSPEEAIEGLTEEQKCEVFKALENIGADMSEQERQKAKEVLVAAVLVGQVILGSSILRIRG
jgi:polyhydroxyalkanoate synthesis regulator phasin